eukprot:363965-Chlamydomonas_euryale.AAC.17
MQALPVDDLEFVVAFDMFGMAGFTNLTFSHRSVQAREALRHAHAPFRVCSTTKHNNKSNNSRLNTYQGS